MFQSFKEINIVFIVKKYFAAFHTTVVNMMIGVTVIVFWFVHYLLVNSQGS